MRIAKAERGVFEDDEGGNPRKPGRDT